MVRADGHGARVPGVGPAVNRALRSRRRQCAALRNEGLCGLLVHVMRRYDAFLFLARALGLPDRDGRNVRALRHDLGRGAIGWEAVVELASQQLVTPALRQALSAKGLLPDLPAEVRDYLEAVHGLNRERNRKITAQVVESTAALNAIGIEPVLLKGVAHLLADLYGDPAVRVIGDIDLLVSAERAADAVGALRRIGYREAGVEDFSFTTHHHHEPLVRGDDACVEVHTEPVLPAFAKLSPAEPVRRSAGPLMVGGYRAWLPSAQDRVAHNIVHGQLADGHYWCGWIALRPLCDLVRLRIAHDDAIDWPQLLAAFDRAGYGGACRAWLMTAQRFLGQAPPQGFAPSLGARVACWRSAAQIRSPRLMAVGETYGYHRAMIARLCGGPIARRQVLGRLLHPKGYRRYLQSFRAHKGRVD